MDKLIRLDRLKAVNYFTFLMFILYIRSFYCSPSKDCCSFFEEARFTMVTESNFFFVLLCFLYLVF